MTKITITQGNKSVQIDMDEVLNSTQRVSRSPIVIKGTRKNKRWTIEEKAEFLRLESEGWSVDRIAQQLGRSKHTIRNVKSMKIHKPQWFKRA
jgi:IS30 family transposase